MPDRIYPHKILLFIILWLVLFACGRESDRKIKLSEGIEAQAGGVRMAASVLQVSTEGQKTIAIFPFRNTDRDTSLAWLSRGLADMFTSELARSLHFDVVPVNRLVDAAENRGLAGQDLVDRDRALELARSGRVALILTGSFARHDGVIKIEASLSNTASGAVLRTETVHGSSLERIFTIVDELSAKLHENLPYDIEKSAGHVWTRRLQQTLVSRRPISCSPK
jgi:TolB-like protein